MEEEYENKQMYWEGVRDALELVINSVDWALAHPEANFDFYEFLYRALNTAKKHCQPRLADLLGVDFNVARKDRIRFTRELIEENEEKEEPEESYEQEELKAVATVY